MMLAIDKYSLVNALQHALEEAKKMPCETRCMECGNFKEGDSMCLKWRETVPKEAQEAGCDQWVYNPNSPPF